MLFERFLRARKIERRHVFYKNINFDREKKISILKKIFKRMELITKAKKKKKLLDVFMFL